jgi:hypothetical protein
MLFWDCDWSWLFHLQSQIGSFTIVATIRVRGFPGLSFSVAFMPASLRLIVDAFEISKCWLLRYCLHTACKHVPRLLYGGIRRCNVYRTAGRRRQIFSGLLASELLYSLLQICYIHDIVAGPLAAVIATTNWSLRPTDRYDQLIDTTNWSLAFVIFICHCFVRHMYWARPAVNYLMHRYIRPAGHLGRVTGFLSWAAAAVLYRPHPVAVNGRIVLG